MVMTYLTSGNERADIMRITAEQTTAIIIDLQERLLPHMHDREAVLSRCVLLLKGLSLLGCPVLFTEQYPAGLGKTVALL